MEYCCHVWTSAPGCYSEMLDKVQKWICTAVGPLLATSFKTLAHCQNVACLSLFYRYYFGRGSSELAQLFPLSYSQGRSTHSGCSVATQPQSKIPQLTQLSQFEQC